MSRPAASSSSHGLNLMIAVVSSALTLAATVALQGCGGPDPVFDQSLKHTPETLVQEFVARYKNLPPNRKPLKASRSAKAKVKGEPRDVDEAGKSSRKEAVVKGEMIKETETLEHVVSTLEERLGKLEGVSRADAARKAAELIENDPVIKPDDKSAVLERLKQLD